MAWIVAADALKFVQGEHRKALGEPALLWTAAFVAGSLAVYAQAIPLLSLLLGYLVLSAMSAGLALRTAGGALENLENWSRIGLLMQAFQCALAVRLAVLLAGAGVAALYPTTDAALTLHAAASVMVLMGLGIAEAALCLIALMRFGGNEGPAAFAIWISGKFGGLLGEIR